MRDLICEVPEGEKGKWKVERFEVTEESCRLTNLRAEINLNCKGRGHINPGMYTRLMCEDECVMSDAPDELADFLWFVPDAREFVLVSGLGLGLAVEALLQNRMVRKVVEIDQDVIDLVGPHYLSKWGGGQLEIIHADALTWKNPMKYVFYAIWHDIWPTLCRDNLPNMAKLHRKGRRWLAKGGVMASWGSPSSMVKRRNAL